MTILRHFTRLCWALRDNGDGTILSAKVHLESVWKQDILFFKEKMRLSPEELIVAMDCFLYSGEIQFLDQEDDYLDLEEVAKSVCSKDVYRFLELTEVLEEKGWLDYLDRITYKKASISIKYQELCTKWRESEWFPPINKPLTDSVIAARAFQHIRRDRDAQNQYLEYAFLKDLMFAAAVVGETISITSTQETTQKILHVGYKDLWYSFFLLIGWGTWGVNKSILETSTPLIIYYGKKSIVSPQYYALKNKNLDDSPIKDGWPDNTREGTISSCDFYNVTGRLLTIFD